MLNALFAAATLASAGGAVTLKAVTHIHSSISHTGSQSLEAIARRAEERGIDVLIPTDTLSARWEYGLWPLSKAVERPSVRSFGIDRYLSELEALQKRHPRLIVIPGVEAAPYYRWTGSPFTTLILKDWHRHLLVIGLDRVEDYEALPVLGGDVFTRRTSWLPYQMLIDEATRRGALTIWAHPEAENWSQPKPVSSRVSVQTSPYPEALVRTMSHHGFGVFMEGFRKVARPGGPWDQALRRYAAGERRDPFWAYGELDYRQTRRDIDIDTVQMIVDAADRSPKAVIEALKRGRFYVVRPEYHSPMVLKEWSVPETCSGDVVISVAYADGSTRKGELELVQDGELLKREAVTIPGRWSHKLARSGGTTTFVRAIVSDEKLGRLVANPLFCGTDR